MIVSLTNHAKERFQQRLNVSTNNTYNLPKGFIVKRYKHDVTNNEIIDILTVVNNRPVVMTVDRTERNLITVITEGYIVDKAMKRLKEKKCVSQNSGLMN